jgi:hypothetical protein
MPITPDQRATLQLLLERGQSYADLGALLGADEAGVRSRARAALTELGGGVDPDRNVGITDYLLGQADPIGRADASRHLRDNPEDRALAAALAERLREMFPGAELPRLPGEQRRGGFLRRSSAAPAPATAPADHRSRLSTSQTRLLVILSSAAVLLVAIVLGVTGAFGGGGDSTSSTSADGTTTTAGGDERAVPITLKAAHGSDAGGVVVFGFATADQPFIEFQIRNLEPAANGDAYVLWFLLGGGKGFPLPTPLDVQPNGTLNNRISVPASVLSFIQQSKAIAIALNDGKKLNRDINQAVQQGQGALDFPGGTVLSADISAATRPGASQGS